MKPRDLHSLLDIVQSAERTVAYTKDISAAEFLAVEKNQDAVIRRLLMIDRAANRISAEGQDAIPELEWSQIFDIQNRIGKEYDNINLEAVWKIAQTEMAELISTIKPIIPSED